MARSAVRLLLLSAVAAATTVEPSVAALSIAAPSVAPSGVCAGFGRSLELRLLRLPTRGARDEARSIYHSFLLRVLTAFRRARADGLMSTLGSWLSAVAAEAERWLERLWSARPAIMASGSDGASVRGANASGAVSSPSASGAASPNTSDGVSHNASANGTHDAQREEHPSCLQHLYALLLRRFDPRPASFVHEPEGWSNGWMLLSGSDRVAALSESVVRNHGEFAARHGYAQWWHRGSLVADLGWQPYWHKVAMLRAAQTRYANASGFIWIDDDIVLTNHAGADMLQRAVQTQSASLLVTRDPSRAAMLNTGGVSPPARLTTQRGHARAPCFGAARASASPR
jgi:hypothetical protein